MTAASLDIAGGLTLGEQRFSFEAAIPSAAHVAVVGPNGAGKSTLLRTLAGLLRLHTGTLRHGGTMLDAPTQRLFVSPHQRRIALQPQDGALFPHLSVLDNVAFPTRVTGASRKDSRTEAHEHLDRVGARDLLGVRTAALSGGQAARVALARSLAAEPDVLLLDEPAAALDVEARAELRRLIADLPQTVLTVTHDPLEARLLGTTYLVVDSGTTTQLGTPDEIAAAPTSPWVAGFAGMNVVSGDAHDHEVQLAGGGRLRLADRAGGPVHVAFPAVSVTLGATRPTGSARNVFAATVTGMVVEGDRVRVLFDAGFSAAALVTGASAHELDLRPGGPVWVSVKATELTVLPA